MINQTAVFSWKGEVKTYSQFMLMMGSVLFAQKLFKRIVLFTDLAGKRLLWDLMDLPFDDVYILPDWPSELSHIFELPKLHAAREMSKRGNQFYHIDFDAFLRRNPSPEFMKADFVCETFTPAWKYIPDFHAGLTVRSIPAAPVAPTIAQGGIIGGRAVDEIGQFAERSIAAIFAQDNRETLKTANGYQASCYFGECCYMETFRSRIVPLFATQSMYWDWGWIHLSGKLKFDPIAYRGAELQIMSDLGMEVWQNIRKKFDLFCFETENATP